MAAMIAARRAPVPKLLEKLLFSPARPTATASRLFSTNAEFRDLDDDRSLEVDHRSDDSYVAPGRRSRGRGFFPSVFSDVFDPFNTTRSLSQLLNMMDRKLDISFAAASPGVGGFRLGWDAREESDALYLLVDMPGLGKENVKVRAEQNTLIIEGEAEKETGEEESGTRYSGRIDLPPAAYKLDQIRAEMKDGVLKVVVTKVKEEERKDVFEIKIE